MCVYYVDRLSEVTCLLVEWSVKHEAYQHFFPPHSSNKHTHHLQSSHLYVCFGFVEQAQGGVAVAVGSQRYEGLQPLQTQPQVSSSAQDDRKYW